VDAAVESKWFQVRDELIARSVTREEFRAVLENLRVEVDARIDHAQAELSGRIEQVQAALDAKIDRPNLKLNFVLLRLVLLATLWNPAVADLLRKRLGLGQPARAYRPSGPRAATPFRV